MRVMIIPAVASRTCPGLVRTAWSGMTEWLLCKRAPKLTAPPYIGRDNRIQGVCGIHLPLSSDGEAVDMILTAVAYRMPG